MSETFAFQLNKVETEQPEMKKKGEELPDEWWYRVYFGVIITTILVISALWFFSRYFS